ncbi:MAG: hypothetical protein NVS3B5_08710 [Sphingomicrobium sp.]
MIEMIRDPLTHIIRNAVDHGIETPGERLKAGKREIGLLAVSARQSGNQILIDIVDDGRGIDGLRLVAKAIANGTLSREAGAAMSPRECLALIFEAGLSTAAEVTAISGRGVGMDVVRSNIERIGGTVEIDSTPGRGTRMTLRVPLTLTIIPALTVSIGVQHFAIPRSAIEEIVRANGSSVALDRIGGSGIATIRGRRMPEIALADLLGLASDLAEEQRTLVVLRPAGGDLFALAVDHIHDHEELVVKPAAPAVMATGLYAGTTLADDGSPILLFDPAGLADQGGIRFETQDRAGIVAEWSSELPVREMPVLLFRGLDGTRRTLPLGVVDRIDEVPAARITLAAGQLRAQLGETILPLAGVPASHPIENKIRILRLSDGHSEIGYAVAEVIDLTSLAHEITPVSTSGAVHGVVLIGGEPAELLDAHWLFAEHAAPPATKASAVCRLAADDPWMQNMLRPIVESAGYRVVGEGDDVPADLTIAIEGGTAAANSARTIWLRSDPEGGARPDSIYRYDRNGLLAAIRFARDAK